MEFTPLTADDAWQPEPVGAQWHLSENVEICSGKRVRRRGPPAHRKICTTKTRAKALVRQVADEMRRHENEKA